MTKQEHDEQKKKRGYVPPFESDGEDTIPERALCALQRVASTHDEKGIMAQGIIVIAEELRAIRKEMKRNTFKQLPPVPQTKNGLTGMCSRKDGWEVTLSREEGECIPENIDSAEVYKILRTAREQIAALEQS